MDYKKELLEKGYFILENIYTPEKIEKFKQEILDFIKKNKTKKHAGGITIPDFVRHPTLSEAASMKDTSKIHDVLKVIFDDNYRFCSHNDIGINRIVDWHKDKLNGRLAKYETIDIWSEHEGEKHEIIKVLTYLEDHSKNNDGLKLVPKSHLKRKVNSKGAIQLKPKLGDVIVFDQRITHRGMEEQVKDPRILVSFGYGKNNIFTDNFEKGTVIRQNKQNK